MTTITVTTVLGDLASIAIVLSSVFSVAVYVKARRIETKTVDIENKATEIHSTIVNNHQDDIDQREGNDGTNPAKGS